MKTEKRKREPIPIPIIEKGDTKRKRTIGSVPLFKTEMLDSESESESLPVNSKYMANVLKSKGSHDPTFGVYQDDKDSSFKIGRSTFKYNNKHVFVDGKKSTSQHRVCGNYWPSRNLIKTWSLFKIDRHINRYYSSLMNIE